MSPSCCWPCSRCPQCSRQPGDPRSNAPRGSAALRPTVWPVTCSRPRQRRRRARKSGSLASSADLPVPGVLRHGIRLEHVSFAYPGTSRLVLDDISLLLPAGSVVAIVGENGAGKTTLVKLLAKMYEPTSGTIHVDDLPL